jgi:hypothetical protein
MHALSSTFCARAIRRFRFAQSAVFAFEIRLRPSAVFAPALLRFFHFSGEHAAFDPAAASSPK